MSMSVEQADLTMKVQVNIQKKIMDNQANNVMKLIEGVTEVSKTEEMGVNRSLASGRLDILA